MLRRRGGRAHGDLPSSTTTLVTGRWRPSMAFRDTNSIPLQKKFRAGIGTRRVGYPRAPTFVGCGRQAGRPTAACNGGDVGAHITWISRSSGEANTEDDAKLLSAGFTRTACRGAR